MMRSTENSRLPIPVIISVKALFLYILFFNYGLINPLSYELPFLPFISVLDGMPAIMYQILSVTLGLSVIIPLLVKKYYQVFAFVAGLIVLLFILSSKILFSNSLTFAACFLLLAGLYFGRVYIFRVQISILYLGAAINKIFSEDWWNGLFMDTLLREVFQVSIYQHFFSAGELSVAVILSVFVMLIELTLGVAVLVPKWTRMVMAAGLLFHIAIFTATGGALSIFFMYLMSAAFIAISDIRLHQLTLQGGNTLLTQLLSRLDVTDTIVVDHENTKTPFKIEKQGNEYEGGWAWIELIKSRQCAIWVWFTVLIGWFLLPRIVQKVVPAFLM